MIYYLITTFIIIVNRIRKRNNETTTELIIFAINLRNIKKALRPKPNFINKEFKKNTTFKIL